MEAPAVCHVARDCTLQEHAPYAAYEVGNASSGPSKGRGAHDVAALRASFPCSYSAPIHQMSNPRPGQSKMRMGASGHQTPLQLV